MSILQKACRAMPSHNYEREKGIDPQHPPEQNSITPTVDPSRFPRTLEQAYRVAGKSLARPGRKQATATEDFDVHISYLLS